MYALAFRLALSQFLQKPVARLLVIVSVACILVINGLVFLLFQSFSRSAAEVQASRFMTAYLESSVPMEREFDVLSAVRKVPGVASAQIVSKDAFLENFSKIFPQLSAQLATLDADTIPRFVKVKVTGGSEASVQRRLEKLSGVEYVELNTRKYAGLVGALKTLRKLAVALMFGMSLALLCILFNHFKLRTPFQSQVRRTLEVLGARGGQILLPFALEGFFEGLLGGGLAAGAILAYGNLFQSQFNAFFSAIGYHPYAFELAPLALGLGVIGTLSGTIGSLWATARAVEK